MKRISLFLIVLIALYSCVDQARQRNQEFPNIQQEEFDSMLAKNKDKESSLGNNKILEKEFNDSVKLAIGKYMDSVRLFVNWKASIQDIDSRELGQSIALSFKLEYTPEEHRKVTFKVDYLVPKDSLNSDKIYNTIKNISENSTVYFDGFIRTKANGEAYYGDFCDDFLMHSYPVFKFFIVDINTTSKGDTLSNNLKRAVDFSFKMVEPLKLNYKKEISKEESSKRINILLPKFNEVKETLTNEERAYVERLTQALAFNFLYAEE